MNQRAFVSEGLGRKVLRDLLALEVDLRGSLHSFRYQGKYCGQRKVQRLQSQRPAVQNMLGQDLCLIC
jgi:hypothetical protein